MITPILTIWGLYQAYPEMLEESIALPEGMDKDIMLDYIFQYCGENEIRYADPELLQRLISRWFQANKKQFERLWYTINAEYNPIENYDRMQDFTENRTVDETGESNSEQNIDTTNTDEQKTSSFDSSSYQPRSQGTSTNKGKQNTMSSAESNRAEKFEHTERTHGNIGVTTSQQMLEEERRIAQWDIYKYIAGRFEDEFTIAVYNRRCIYGV